MMQEMYTKYLEENDDWKNVKKDEVWLICMMTHLWLIQDPFWDPPEDIVVGSASAFLQSLSYGLDFEDSLMLTDHRGNDQGSLSVVLTPCNKAGKSLGDDFFVEDPKDLLDKGIVHNLV